jgi:hypothetical protein
LAAVLDGPGKSVNRPRLQQPRVGETQIEAVQIDFQRFGGGGACDVDRYR